MMLIVLIYVVWSNILQRVQDSINEYILYLFHVDNF